MPHDHTNKKHETFNLKSNTRYPYVVVVVVVVACPPLKLFKTRNVMSFSDEFFNP